MTPYRTQLGSYSPIGVTHRAATAVALGTAAVRVEVQAQATMYLPQPKPWRNAVSVSGISATDAREMLNRLSGVLTRLGHPAADYRIVLHFQGLTHKIRCDPRPMDMAAVIVLLQANGGYRDCRFWENVLYICPLDSSGNTVPTPTAPLLALAAKPGEDVLVPYSNMETVWANVWVQSGVEIGVIRSISEVIDGEYDVLTRACQKPEVVYPDDVMDFAEIVGQSDAKRAAVISAAGGHAMLCVGPPGSGKTTIAKGMLKILPDLSPEEQLQVFAVYAAEGKPMRIGVRPFRAVHHTASRQALIGGGSSGAWSAGEVTLAHAGVLFLDELPEFSRDSLEALRQPMESGEVVVSRVGSKISLPCRFTLVAAMNPCPCGYYGAEERICTCQPNEVRAYQRRISGPLLDRIDLKVYTQPVSPSQLLASAESRPTSAALQRGVQQAVEIQRRRYEEKWVNADAPFPMLMARANMTADAKAWLQTESERLMMSARQVSKAVRVARTIADLDNQQCVEMAHVTEAVRYVV